MEKKIIFIILLLCALSWSAKAQIEVSGRVMDLQNAPIGNVIVKAVDKGKTLHFTTTDMKGMYSLKMKVSPPDGFVLMFNHVSFEKDSVTIETKGPSIRQDIVLYPRLTTLKEVIFQTQI